MAVTVPTTRLVKNVYRVSKSITVTRHQGIILHVSKVMKYVVTVLTGILLQIF